MLRRNIAFFLYKQARLNTFYRLLISATNRRLGAHTRDMHVIKIYGVIHEFKREYMYGYGAA